MDRPAQIPGEKHVRYGKDKFGSATSAATEWAVPAERCPRDGQMDVQNEPRYWCGQYRRRRDRCLACVCRRPAKPQLGDGASRCGAIPVTFAEGRGQVQ